MRLVMTMVLLVTAAGCNCGGDKPEDQQAVNLVPDAGCMSLADAKKKAGVYMEMVKPTPVPSGNERPCDYYVLDEGAQLSAVEYRCTADHSALLDCAEQASSCYHVATPGFVCDYGWWVLR